MRRRGRLRVPWLLGALALIGLAACAEVVETSRQAPLVSPADGDPLARLLERERERLGAVLDDPEGHRLQILYTRIDRDADGTPRFTDHGFRVDEGEYFYPASTVKLPTALLALERLHQLDVEGLDRDTPMYTDVGAPLQTAVSAHPRAPGGVPTVGHYVREIFAVSDNDAFNRLYEFLGQAPLAAALAAHGLAHTRIIHRLSLPLPFEANRTTNPVRFERAGVALHVQGARRSGRDLRAPQPVPLGRGEMIDGVLAAGPKDFADKNAYPLADLHATLRALIFPASVPAPRRFDLAAEDRAFVLRAMGSTPAESGLPAYADADEYPPTYVKFLLGGGGSRDLPAGVRSFNKVGDAYGFLTDAAYVVDLDAGVEFLLSATVYVNADGIFNDDVYEYDELGLPFLAELGSAVLEMERARARRHAPDLTPLRTLFDVPAGAHGSATEP